MTFHRNVLGVVLIAYVISSAAAWLSSYHLHWTLAALVFWVGGAFATLGVSCVVYLLSNKRREVAQQGRVERPLREQLDRWEKDRAREQAEAHVARLKLLADQETTLRTAARPGRAGEEARPHVVLPPLALLRPPPGPAGD